MTETFPLVNEDVAQLDDIQYYKQWTRKRLLIFILSSSVQ